MQYVLADAKINTVSVLITLSYFTDIYIYSTVYKYIFPKYFFAHCRPFFFSLLWQLELLLENYEIGESC